MIQHQHGSIWDSIGSQKDVKATKQGLVKLLDLLFLFNIHLKDIGVE